MLLLTPPVIAQEAAPIDAGPSLPHQQESEPSTAGPPVHVPQTGRAEPEPAAPEPDASRPTASPVTAAALAMGRTAENAVRQAEDAFGFSVGRESLGLYSSQNVRGFSPFAAGNVRIERLYFDPFLTLITRLRQSTSIKVGLSAQGYPFPSPTGIVDYAFRKPGDVPSVSLLVSGDTYRNVGVEADVAVPLASGLSLGLGVNGAQRLL